LEDEGQDVSNYWTTLRKIEDTGNWVDYLENWPWKRLWVCRKTDRRLYEWYLRVCFSGKWRNV